MTAEPLNHWPDVLNSWKEIAGYLDRGIRTVQRWEVDLGLPVRRPREGRRSPVFAFRIELDAWLKSCPIEKRENSGEGAAIEIALEQPTANGKSGPSHAQNLEHYANNLIVTRQLIDEGLRIRKDSRETRAQLNDAISRLRQTVGKLSFSPRKFKSSLSAAAVVSPEDSSPRL